MKRTATAVWQGSLGEGTGTIDTQSGALSSHGYSFESRFTDESGKAGTNPEELLAAAHAGCFAMQLAHMLAENGTPADRLDAKGTVSVDQDGGGFTITSANIALDAKVPSIEHSKFDEIAEAAHKSCPLSKALGSVATRELKTTLSS